MNGRGNGGRGRRFNALSSVLACIAATCACAPAAMFGCSTALAASSPSALQADSAFTPYIVGGQEASISQFPWQVYLVGRHPEGGDMVEMTSCGGSILNATTILTAAHCVDKEGTTETYSAEEFAVLAGASNEAQFTEFYALTGLAVPPEGGQALRVARIRADPYYTVLPDIKDDVAVLTLEGSLELSEEAHAQAIPLVPEGDTPAPGTTLSLSGYGKQNGAESARPNGGLYSTTLTAISSDACREMVGVNSAVLLCAQSASSSACEGDSGGPLTEGSPAVQVGIVDFGAKECNVGRPNAFTNVAAPEVRAFIEGSESPPIAARPSSPPVIKSAGPAPVDYGPLTCEPGSWSGSPTFDYTFQAENGSEQALQSGAANVFTPSAKLIGTPVVCIVQASNPGGVTTFRSVTTPAIAADSTPPAAKLGGLACQAQTCTLSFTATDPNGVALTEQPSAAYVVDYKCPVKAVKQKRDRHGKVRGKIKASKQPMCRRDVTGPMALTEGLPGAFQATVSGLPYEQPVTFIVDVSNAAGLQATPVSDVITLHSPHRKPKPKPRAKSKRSKRRHRH